VIYALAAFAAHRLERASDGAASDEAGLEQDGGGAVTLYLRFGVAAVVVIAAGLWLPFVGTEMARVLGFNETFVGTLFIAFATSVPEVVVSVAAVRIGSPNMAVSNLLGSNLVNVLILVPEDLLLAGPILAAASTGHLLSAISAVTMTAIFAVALLARPRSGRFAVVNVLLLAIYLANAYMVYRNHV
jgi:cation:H+ antiporter